MPLLCRSPEEVFSPGPVVRDHCTIMVGLTSTVPLRLAVAGGGSGVLYKHWCKGGEGFHMAGKVNQFQRGSAQYDKDTGGMV